MNDSVIDILIYIYESFLEADQSQGHVLMQEELLSAGFNENKINMAFDWLDELVWIQAAMRDAPQINTTAPRIYNAHEMQHINTECQGMLSYLEQNEVIDPICREIIIERAMALKTEELDEETMQWIVLMVLISQPDKQIELNIMKEILYDSEPKTIH